MTLKPRKYNAISLRAIKYGLLSFPTSLVASFCSLAALFDAGAICRIELPCLWMRTRSPCFRPRSWIHFFGRDTIYEEPPVYCNFLVSSPCDKLFPLPASSSLDCFSIQDEFSCCSIYA